MHSYVTRRDFLRQAAMMGVTASAAGLLAACAPKTVEVEKEKTVVVQQTVEVEKEITVAPKGRVTVEWWFGWGANGEPVMHKTLEAFNLAHADVYVHGLSTDNGSKLLPSIAAGTPPDLALGNIPFPELAARGSLLPLDDYFAKSKVFAQKDDIVNTLWEDGQWEGKQYGLGTLECGPRVGYAYNADLVSSAGLDPDKPPLTWDEAYDWHTKVTKFDKSGNLEILGFDPLDACGGLPPRSDIQYVWGVSFGFQWWDQKTYKFNLTDEKFVQVLKTIKKFYDFVGVEKMKAYRSTYGMWSGYPTASFDAGVEGAMISGYWTPGQEAATNKAKLGYTWVPNVEERRGKKFQLPGGHPAVIPQGAKNPDQAFMFMEYLSTAEALDIAFNVPGAAFMGPRISWLKTVDKNKWPGFAFYLDSVLNADELYSCPRCPIEGFVGQQLAQTYDAVNYAKKTPEQAAQELQDILTTELRKQFPNLGG